MPTPHSAQDAESNDASVEERLHEEQIRLAAVIDSLPLGLVMTDVEDHPIMTNQALSRLLSYDSEKPLIDQLGDSFDLWSLCKQCRQEQAACVPQEYSFGDKHVRIFVKPIMSNDVAVGAVALFEDISEQKALERSRDEFFAVASHELRTPLTAIRGNAAMIKQYFSEELAKLPEVMEMINDTHDSSVRLIEIVNDFLDVSRLEQKRIEFNFEETNIVELVEDVLKDLEGNAKEKGITLALEKASEPIPAVKADKNRTKQVLFNLLGNAVKFTDHGEVKATIEMPEGRFVKIKVSDTGSGIAPENHHLLFRKFQQAGDKILARDMTQGTGMGLYISKLLIEGMGGQIKLESSAVGKGSVFSFTLPVIQ